MARPIELQDGTVASERLPDAEVEAAPLLSGTRVEHPPVICPQQYPPRAQPNADASRLAQVPERKIFQCRIDVADIEERHAVDDPDERHPQLVVEHQRD